MNCNYFKVRTATGQRLFWFDHHDRESTRRAFGQASATPGVLSVFFPIPIGGEWNTVPVILDVEPVMMLRPLRKVTPGPLMFVPFGEGGCW